MTPTMATTLMGRPLDAARWAERFLCVVLGAFLAMVGSGQLPL